MRLVKLHTKYGPIIRIAPNKLDVSHADMIGLYKQGRAALLTSLIKARDPETGETLEEVDVATEAFAFSWQIPTLQTALLFCSSSTYSIE
jgi:hypothetical protein